MAGIESLQSPVTTSLRPTDIWRCLRLKLWDPEHGRLVTFAEARRSRRPAALLTA
jgi:omega-6 fatty acid desaturase (delta-12 desaturase)